MEFTTTRKFENSKKDNCMREVLYVSVNGKQIIRIHNGNGKKAMKAYPKFENIKAFCEQYLSNLPNDFARVEKIVKKAGRKFNSLEEIWALAPLETVEAEQIIEEPTPVAEEPKCALTVAENRPVVALERLNAEQKASLKDIYARCKTSKDKALVLDTIVALM